jgi:signal transduction histidine kinase
MGVGGISDPGGGVIVGIPIEIDYRQGSLSTLPVGPHERRVARAVVIVSALAFVAAVPFVRVPLAEVPAFIPSYESALAINDLITSVLLFGAFATLRSRALLALACGYLFDALIMVPHALSFPGVFSETGLLGAGPQTTAWLYVFWHGSFPLFIIAYSVLANRGAHNVLHCPVPMAVMLAIGAVVALVSVLTLMATAGHDLLPEVIRGGDYSMLVSKGVSPAIWLLSLLALIVLWRRRQTSVLDLWLMVVMSAWLFDVALSAVIGSSRYDLGFYAGRIYGLLAASFVLIALLVETSGLYRRLAAARTELEDRVRERTVELQRAVEALKSETAERLQTQAQLVQAQKMEALGTLASGIAHDLNNTLVPVLALTKLMMKRHPESSREHTNLATILRAGERGRDLVHRILAFTRKEAPIRRLILPRWCAIRSR